MDAPKYRQVKVSVLPEVASAFKAACKADKVSMASEISGFMAARAGFGGHLGRPKKDLLESRGGRRKLMDMAIGQLERIKDAEEQYKSNMPENLCGSPNYEAAEQCVACIEDALGLLEEAF
jgi:hypothetical protein